jgi:hypothetical protein
VILVEGESDKAAVETLAIRYGRKLEGEGVRVLAMGGITNLGSFIDRLGPAGEDVALRGLYDVAEEAVVQRYLRPLLGASRPSRHELGQGGFHVCDRDLEDELIRALGVPAVLDLFESQGELTGLRTLQGQPAWRGRPVEEQVRRFIGVRSGRKIRYGSLLVEALDLERVPAPLQRVLNG